MRGTVASGTEFDGMSEWIVTYSQEIRVEGQLPTAAIFRLMASADQGMVTRFSKAAIKNMPALPPPMAEPTHWDGQPVTQ